MTAKHAQRTIFPLATTMTFIGRIFAATGKTKRQNAVAIPAEAGEATTAAAETSIVQGLVVTKDVWETLAIQTQRLKSSLCKTAMVQAALMELAIQRRQAGALTLHRQGQALTAALSLERKDAKAQQHITCAKALAGLEAHIPVLQERNA